MKTTQFKLNGTSTDNESLSQLTAWKPDLVMAFGHASYFEPQKGIASTLQQKLNTKVIGCSSAGEISDAGTHDKSLVLTGIQFGKIKFKTEIANMTKTEDSQKCGEELGKKLATNDLKAIIILGKGLAINGSALIAGFKKAVGDKVIITGGLAGDGGAFQRTYVMHDKTVDAEGVVALGLYGDNVEIGFGHGGGWDPFGPVRKVTKAIGTKLFELDGEKALNVYKTYLKDFAKDLPASGLLFPFALLDSNQSVSGLIRTILGIDEAEGSLQLAGDIHEGQLVRLMHTKNQGLVNGAENAAKLVASQHTEQNGLTLIVSCVGRKLVMGEDLDEEIEVVQNTLKSSNVAGFYSYGEIAPFRSATDSQLHNQTMTITHINEKKAA